MVQWYWGPCWMSLCLTKMSPQITVGGMWCHPKMEGVLPRMGGAVANRSGGSGEGCADAMRPCFACQGVSPRGKLVTAYFGLIEMQIQRNFEKNRN